MCIIADYHLHTDHSGDSKAPMETQILTGIEKGLKIMCFTDHYDPDFPYENVPDVFHPARSNSVTRPTGKNTWK